MIRRFSVSLLFSLCTPILLGQGDRGSIADLVSDPSGGVVPGVTIEAVNQATNLRADTVTTATGNYRLVALPIGRYTLTATVPGFQTYVRQDIQVQVNQTTTIDIALRVGQVAETVTVIGGARHLYLNRSSFALPGEGRFGNAPRYLEVRGPARLDESFAVVKNTRIGEGLTHQFRMETLNPLNRVVFGAPVTDITQVNFGRISSTQINPRQIQFGMKLIF